MLTSAVKRLTTVIKTVQTLLDHTPVAAILAFKFMMQMGILVMVCAHTAGSTIILYTSVSVHVRCQ